MKSAQHKKFSKWFCPRPEAQIETRSQKNRFKPVPYRTAAFARSAIPTMTIIAMAIKNGFNLLIEVRSFYLTFVKTIIRV